MSRPRHGSSPPRLRHRAAAPLATKRHCSPLLAAAPFHVAPLPSALADIVSMCRFCATGGGFGLRVAPRPVATRVRTVLTRLSYFVWEGRAGAGTVSGRTRMTAAAGVSLFRGVTP